MQNYRIELIKVTGYIIIANRSVRTYTGSKEELQEIYKKVKLHNLLFGWWGFIAVIWNVMALRINAKAKRQLAEAK